MTVSNDMDRAGDIEQPPTCGDGCWPSITFPPRSLQIAIRRARWFFARDARPDQRRRDMPADREKMV